MIRRENCGDMPAEEPEEQGLIPGGLEQMLQATPSEIFRQSWAWGIVAFACAVIGVHALHRGVGSPVDR